MTYEEFIKEVKELRDKDYGAIQYDMPEDNLTDTIVPNVRYYVDGIRGYVSFDDALNFYKEVREELQDKGIFWKRQFIKYLRLKTGYGYHDLDGFVNTFIEALKRRPKATMDKPDKMEINWK